MTSEILGRVVSTPVWVWISAEFYIKKSRILVNAGAPWFGENIPSLPKKKLGILYLRGSPLKYQKDIFYSQNTEFINFRYFSS